jgi:hypothetical protein
MEEGEADLKRGFPFFFELSEQSKLHSTNEHTVAIAEKPVATSYGVSVGGQNVFTPGKCADQSQQS